MWTRKRPARLTLVVDGSWPGCPVIAWAGLIFAFSAQPNLRFVADASLDFLARKAGHMAVFGILALLL
jgi:hypothetical protein